MIAVIIIVIAIIVFSILANKKSPKNVVKNNLPEQDKKIDVSLPDNLSEELYTDLDGRFFRIRKYSERQERRTYLFGDFDGKYWGEFYFDGKYLYSTFKHFAFKIYEGKIFIHNKAHQFNTQPFLIENGVLLPAESLPDKFFVEVREQDASEYYELEIKEVEFVNFYFSPDLHQTENKEVFGTIRSQITGYILDFIIVEKEEKVFEGTENVKQQLILTNVETGNNEKKTGYYRKEYFFSDYKTVGWGPWINEASIAKSPISAPSKWSAQSILGGCFSVISYILFIVLIVVGLVSLLSAVPHVLAILLILFGLYLIRVLINRAARYFSFIIGLIAIYFVFQLLIYKPVYRIKPAIAQDADESIVSPFPIIKQSPQVINDTISEEKTNDSLIIRFRRWKDIKGKIYEGSYIIHINDYIESKAYKNGISLPNIPHQYEYMLYSLKENDFHRINGIYIMFDSIGTSNKMNRKDFAEMVMGFVQDIPYYTVLPLACDANLYNDEFIKSYLASDTSRCDPDERFGINTPVEFITTLKGDCDTRTLLLYLLYSHYGYDVVVLSNDIYSHSMIGINLDYSGYYYPYNDHRYYLWETTSMGNSPGITDPALGEVSNWRISLKSK